MTGTRRPELLRLAGFVDDLAAAMRGSLARILYLPDDFSWVLDRDTLPATFLPGKWPDPNKYNVVGGAWDMCAHTTDYFAHEMTKHEPWPPVLPGLVGNLVVGLAPPARLGDLIAGVDDGESDTNEAWLITNPDDCASLTRHAADDQYGILLATSGYLGMVQLSALLHHLSASQSAARPSGANRSRFVRRSPADRQPRPASRSFLCPATALSQHRRRSCPQHYMARVELPRSR
jgi:hypothetical protein